MSTPSVGRTRERAVVVGAGMIGVATAFFLRKAGLEVTIVDRSTVGAGASWGNAGWVTPNLVAPLAEPAILRYGLRALTDAHSPVFVPPSLDPRLWRFLSGFVASCTTRKWDRSMAAYAPLSRQARQAFDEVEDSVSADLGRRSGRLLAACETDREHDALMAELRAIERYGLPLDAQSVSGAKARSEEPSLGRGVSRAITLSGQSYVDPGRWVSGVADSLRADSGVQIHEDCPVDRITSEARSVRLWVQDSQVIDADVVVVAAGAWSYPLTRPLGVRTVVQAGRGYSFSVSREGGPDRPVYLPGRRVVCTPWRDRLRIAGMMELRGPDAALDPRRIGAIVESVRKLLPDVDVDSRSDEWVGSRPCTPDGRPLIGRTSDPRVWVAGGHAMWGITLGPVTGKLLAGSISYGRVAEELRPFNPLR